MRFSFLKRLQVPRVSLAACMLISAALAHADLLSDNASNSTDGTETASGDRWLTASFGTGGSPYKLQSVTLLLANTSGGVAEVDLYTDGGLQPESLLETLRPPSSTAADLTPTTFISDNATLSPNSTYWIVLKADSGELDWAWTADDSGTGEGFQDTWGLSDDAGASWYTYDVYPTQFSVNADVSGAPEPSTKGLLAAAGFLTAGILLLRRYRNQDGRG
ncbi:MAG TPA: choice-of-anchor R domain-containing protein [Bryobacteraceae bacterium]|nr:choice-of-anchor R domain-containing protein [Bryobacteraceae bacterium]